MEGVLDDLGIDYHESHRWQRRHALWDTSNIKYDNTCIPDAQMFGVARSTVELWLDESDVKDDNAFIPDGRVKVTWLDIIRSAP